MSPPPPPPPPHTHTHTHSQPTIPQQAVNKICLDPQYNIFHWGLLYWGFQRYDTNQSIIQWQSVSVSVNLRYSFNSFYPPHLDHFFWIKSHFFLTIAKLTYVRGYFVNLALIYQNYIVEINSSHLFHSFCLERWYGVGHNRCPKPIWHRSPIQLRFHYVFLP